MDEDAAVSDDQQTDGHIEWMGNTEVAKRRADQSDAEYVRRGRNVVFVAVERIAMCAFLCAAAVDLLWHGWSMTAKAFPMWHIPTTSLHQFGWICGLLICSAGALGSARRNWLSK